MKLLARGSEHADLYRVAAATATAILLVVLFIATQPVNLDRHNTLIRYFGQLQKNDALLGESVLQLHFNLANNYDQITAISKNMRNILNKLRSQEVSGELLEDAEFRQQLQLLEQYFQTDLEVLEKFKSKNSILKNSLYYLPRVRDELGKDLFANQTIRKNIDGLVEEVLFERINASNHERDHIAAGIHALKNIAATQPPNIRNKLDTLLRHISLADQLEHDIPALIKQLTRNGESEQLSDAYRNYHDRQQKHATGYRLFLLLATLATLGYAAFVFLRLREKSRNLQLSASVIAHAHECIIITDTESRIVDVNPAFTRVTGYTREEALGKTPRLLQSGRHDQTFYAEMWQSIINTGRWSGEVWSRRKNGEIYPEWLSITTVTGEDGITSHYVGSCIDISERKQSEADLHNLAFFDPLTQLPNRRMLMDHLHQVLSIGTSNTGHGALLLIDINNFKDINDTRGHIIGDILLLKMANRIKSCVSNNEFIARTGGDEFAIVLGNLDNEAAEAKAQISLVARKILDAINQPCQLQEHEYHITTSIGIALYREHEISGDELFMRADSALHQAKQFGRNMLCFFDPAMQSELEERMMLESALRVALQQQQFSLHYQAQIDHTRQIAGAEALLRWTHPEHGLIPPTKFIPLAEENSLILPIGQWVLEAACEQIKAWEASPLTRDLELAINVSAKQFHQPDFVQHVKDVLARTAIIPSRLKLELTESMVLDDIDETIIKMNLLKLMGVRFSMDDFGTGYSSLAYLTQLPIDQLKIDQSFVRNIGTKSTDAAIIQTIVGMANNLGMEVIAEGVETQAQRDFLGNIGCLLYQGYLFNRPGPIEDFDALMRKQPEEAESGDTA